MAVLSINNISKSYGSVRALNGVSFDVPEGSVFGVLGPNGSGKTTLLGILLNVLRSNSGDFSWFNNMKPHDARKHIGSLLETPNFYHYLSAVKNLEITARIKNKSTQDIDRVLDIVRLTARKDSKFSTYSLGMKQRLAIANALLGKPKVLLLDEPTNGLDPEGIAEIRELILQLNQQGITVIMASHLLDEVEKVCNHVAVLKKGELLLSGDVQSVFQSEDQLEIGASDIIALKNIISQMPGVKEVTTGHNLLRLTLADDLTSYDVNRFCFEKGITLHHLNLRKKSLESKFMELTKTINPE